jgi:hypothetical protein
MKSKDPRFAPQPGQFLASAFLTQPIVLSQPDGVHQGQLRLLVAAKVTWDQFYYYYY